MAIELEITVDTFPFLEVGTGPGDGAITAVVVTSPSAMNGESDAVCVGCGAMLLDWGAFRGADAAWKRYHDERRPAWDELNTLARDLALPPVDTWTAIEQVSS